MDPISRVEGTQFAPRTLPAAPRPAEAPEEKYHALEITDEVSVRALTAQSGEKEEVRKSDKKKPEPEKVLTAPKQSSPQVAKFINQVEDEFYLNSGNLTTDKFKDLDLNGPSYPHGEIITLNGLHLSPPKTLLME
ncbi:MAG: hypothetical protein M1269_05385 [Chloroflexi bacterium]|nr:hypothetical protein [Chloroflexota bacterium]